MKFRKPLDPQNPLVKYQVESEHSCFWIAFHLKVNVKMVYRVREMTPQQMLNLSLRTILLFHTELGVDLFSYVKEYHHQGHFPDVTTQI